MAATKPTSDQVLHTPVSGPQTTLKAFLDTTPNPSAFMGVLLQAPDDTSARNSLVAAKSGANSDITSLSALGSVPTIIADAIAAVGGGSGSTIVRVADFGAVGDGVADDTAAINAAIASLPADGGIVEFGIGVFNITSTIEIGNGTSSALSTKQGIRLVGAGAGTTDNMTIPVNKGTTLKWAGSAGGRMVRWNGPLYGCAMKGFKLEGNTLAGEGLHFMHVSMSFFEDILVTHQRGDAFYITSYKAPFGGMVTGANTVVCKNLVAAAPTTGYSASGLVLGPAGSAALGDVDVARWHFISCEMQWDASTGSVGNGYVFQFCDNCTFYSCYASPFGGTVGKAIWVIPVPGTTGQFPAANQFYACAFIGGFGVAVGSPVWSPPAKFVFLPLVTSDDLAVPTDPGMVGVDSTGAAFNGFAGGGGGSGTVSAGAAGQLAYYASNGTVVSGESSGFAGTGKFVRATSPTINSPTLSNPTLTGAALGTPSSGTLTNCTNLPIANTTGTLPASRGGTGTTSAPNYNGVVYGTGSSYASTAAPATPYGKMLIHNPIGPFPQWSDAVAAKVYSTVVSGTDGTANAFFDETSAFARIGGDSGIILAVGGAYPSTTGRVVVDTGTMRPFTDNGLNLGVGSHRYSAVYAVTGTINTSDRNQKQDIADLDIVEKRVALRLKGLIKKFRFQDAVTEKGDEARIHVGVIAQEVQDAFSAEGLDAHKYAVFCEDTWEESDGTITTRLGVRYEQLFAFVISVI